MEEDHKPEFKPNGEAPTPVAGMRNVPCGEPGTRYPQPMTDPKWEQRKKQLDALFPEMPGVNRFNVQCDLIARGRNLADAALDYLPLSVDRNLLLQNFASTVKGLSELVPES